MKPILLAAASLVTAGAAFGFAKGVDLLLSEPVARQRSAPIITERVSPRTVMPPTAAPTAAPGSIDLAPAIKPEIAVREVTMMAGASDALSPAAQDTGKRSTHFPDDRPAMFLLPQTDPLSSRRDDLGRQPRAYNFSSVPLIGVYR
ncbi:hypothetical protein H4P12_08850 [Paracoccus sp. 11-3]|uniref:Uncharacterized protein n=1 Tax=Paracoccus amoyensis TaxID=2760093 RepID=A0A926JCW1_9RHOB|nr:hypothetical protein [Paracoccus amoyensis]MBC9246819.1 hypothetical protein [Paracoccus amoyensis]